MKLSKLIAGEPAVQDRALKKLHGTGRAQGFGGGPGMGTGGRKKIKSRSTNVWKYATFALLCTTCLLSATLMARRRLQADPSLKAPGFKL